jgi:hypothetical protein
MDEPHAPGLTMALEMARGAAEIGIKMVPAWQTDTRGLKADQKELLAEFAEFGFAPSGTYVLELLKTHEGED